MIADTTEQTNNGHNKYNYAKERKLWFSREKIIKNSWLKSFLTIPPFKQTFIDNNKDNNHNKIKFQYKVEEYKNRIQKTKFKEYKFQMVVVYYHLFHLF